MENQKPKDKPESEATLPAPTGSVEAPNLNEAIEHLKKALDEAGRNMALNTLYHAERAAELAEKVVKHRMSNPPNS